MNWHKKLFTGALTVATALVLCGIPDMAQAQSAAQPTPTTQQPAAPASQQAAPAPQTTAPDQAPTGPATVDPSQGPLQPVPVPETATPPDEGQQAPPENPTPQQPPAANTNTQQAPAAQTRKPAEPVGTAAAEKGVTAGGPGSKPAGNAIAPAKQHQVRSLLIKLGAIGAAGIALGTIFALSHSSPGAPPGTK